MMTLLHSEKCHEGGEDSGSGLSRGCTPYFKVQTRCLLQLFRPPAPIGVLVLREWRRILFMQLCLPTMHN